MSQKVSKKQTNTLKYGGGGIVICTFTPGCYNPWLNQCLLIPLHSLPLFNTKNSHLLTHLVHSYLNNTLQSKTSQINWRSKTSTPFFVGGGKWPFKLPSPGCSNPWLLQCLLIPLAPRILDILILQDKTLFCAFEDNFKQNGVFWRQHLPAVRVWTLDRRVYTINTFRSEVRWHTDGR